MVVAATARRAALGTLTRTAQPACTVSCVHKQADNTRAQCLQCQPGGHGAGRHPGGPQGGLEGGGPAQQLQRAQNQHGLPQLQGGEALQQAGGRVEGCDVEQVLQVVAAPPAHHRTGAQQADRGGEEGAGRGGEVGRGDRQAQQPPLAGEGETLITESDKTTILLGRINTNFTHFSEYIHSSYSCNVCCRPFCRMW